MKSKVHTLGIIFFAFAFFSCKEAAEGVDQTADHLTGKNQIEKKKDLEQELKNINQQHNKQLEDATKAN